MEFRSMSCINDATLQRQALRCCVGLFLFSWHLLLAERGFCHDVLQECLIDYGRA